VPVLPHDASLKNEIERRAEMVVAGVVSARSQRLKLELLDGESVIGGGAAPSAVLPTRLIAFTHARSQRRRIERRLRGSEPPVIARVEDGRVLFDLRTVFPEQDGVLVNVLSFPSGSETGVTTRGCRVVLGAGRRFGTSPPNTLPVPHNAKVEGFIGTKRICPHHRV